MREQDARRWERSGHTNAGGSTQGCKEDVGVLGSRDPKIEGRGRLLNSTQAGKYRGIARAKEVCKGVNKAG